MTLDYHKFILSIQNEDYISILRVKRKHSHEQTPGKTSCTDGETDRILTEGYKGNTLYIRKRLAEVKEGLDKNNKVKSFKQISKRSTSTLYSLGYF